MKGWASIRQFTGLSVLFSSKKPVGAGMGIVVPPLGGSEHCTPGFSRFWEGRALTMRPEPPKGGTTVRSSAKQCEEVRRALLLINRQEVMMHREAEQRERGGIHGSSALFVSVARIPAPIR